MQKYHIDLLKIYDKDNKSHYAIIKSLSRLLNCQINKNINKKHICRYCTTAFSRKDLLDKHIEKGCVAIEGQNIELPKKGEYLEFEKCNTKLKCPFVIDGHFECLTTTSSNEIKGTYQHHKPCGYMLNVKNSIDNSCQPYLYRGEDCMDKFVDQLTEIKETILSKMKTNLPMEKLSEEQKLQFKNATRCSIYNKQFQENNERVRDHCHFTGKYRGWAHNKYNFDYSWRYFKIPIFFHNFKNYDAHLIINKANEISTKLNPNKGINVLLKTLKSSLPFHLAHVNLKIVLYFLQLH